MINKLHTLTSEVSLWLVLHDLAMDEKVRSGWSNFPSFALRKKVVNGSWAKKRIIHWITQNTDIVISLQEQNKTKESQNSISEALHRQKKSRALGKSPHKVSWDVVCHCSLTMSYSTAWHVVWSHEHVSSSAKWWFTLWFLCKWFSWHL